MSQRLPGIDLAIDDNAIAGSFDLGVFEAQRGIIELSLRLICRSFRHLDQRLQRKPGKVNSVNFSLGDERVIVLTKGSRAIFVVPWLARLLPGDCHSHLGHLRRQRLANQRHRMPQDDGPAMGCQVAHPRCRHAAEERSERAQDDDIGRADANAHVADAGWRHAAHERGNATGRQNRTTDVRHEDRDHRTNVHIRNASTRHSHGDFPFKNKPSLVLVNESPKLSK
jgi:hypothetical protein